jgi:hypothetical protein
MARNQKHKIRPAGRIIDLLMDGKKTVLATSLVLVMAVMWIRVLIGHQPGSAAAAVRGDQTAAAGRKDPAPARIRMVDLPRIPGRNDTILRDCFNMQNRTPFRLTAAAPSTGTGTEVQIVSPNHDQEVVEQVALTLKLEAVVRSDTPWAFVNDRMLRLGDKFTVERGADKFEFEVLHIYEDAVLVECRGIQLTLKLAQFADVRK